MSESRVRIVIFALIALVIVFIVGRGPLGPWLLAQNRTADVSPGYSRNKRSEPLFCQAAEIGDVKKIAELLDKGADIGALGQNGTALELATRHGHNNVIKLLLDRGADPNKYRLTSPLEIATGQGQREIVRMLLDHGADPNKYHYTPPLEFAIAGMPEVVPELIKRGAKVTSATLVSAILARNPEMVALLIRQGAPVNAPPRVQKNTVSEVRDQIGQMPYPPVSPLAIAAYNAPEFENMLLRLGANLGPDKKTILVWLAHSRHQQYIPHLIALGADTNGVSVGESPLTQAVFSSPDAVAALLEHGAKPDFLTIDGRTPLKEAVISGDVNSVRLLLAHGAKVNFHTKVGHGPLWFAQKQHRSEIAAILQQAGGRED